MAKQMKKAAEPRTRVPEQVVSDKDQYTAGGPRPRPQSPYADNPPKRDRSADARNEPKEVDEEDRGDAPVEGQGKWKPEGEPPYARTYKEPLDEEGNPEG